MSGPASSARPTPLWAVALGGLATALAFPLQPLPDQPPISLWPLCFVGPAPFLARLLTADSVWSAAKTGLVFAMAWFLVAGCWVFRVFDVMGWVLIWLPIGWVVVFAVAAHVVRKAGFSPNWSWPLLWIAVEFIRAEWTPIRLDWFSADLDALNFTWFGLGHPRLAVTFICGPAELLGGYFLSLLPIVAALTVARHRWTNRINPRIVAPLYVLFFMETGLMFSLRARRMPGLLFQAVPQLKSISIPGFDWVMNWKDRSVIGVGVVQSERFDRQVLLDLTSELPRHHSQLRLIVWPEESFTARPIERDLLGIYAQQKGFSIVAGVEESQTFGGHSNVAWWIPSKGEPGKYHKKQRVPFVEHHPASDATPIFDLPDANGGTPIRVGVLICYDIDFAWNARQTVALGAEVLAVPTLDDGNWGGTQHAQHALMARLRAVEVDRPIVQAATSGVSQIIGDRGEVLADIPFRLVRRPDRKSLYHEDVAWADIQPTNRLSPYCAGGWLAGPIVAIAGMGLVGKAFVLLRRKQVTNGEPGP